MPLSRYQVRNEYSLADPELYRAADKDDPEALLEGVAMAGLVGVLRQLGDLAEFAAEIFHDLHEEVMVTAARGHTLMVRVQQLESEFPPIEKAILSQTRHSTFYGSTGIDWHPNLQMNQNLITKGDLPRFVMDSYEECRGPPRLFLLDKFDVAGAGACLKRYTDPSLYKLESSAYEMARTDVQRDKRIRKAKKKGPRWKNGDTPEVLPSTKLHQLFLEERVENGASDPARLVKLKRKPNASALGSDNGKSYMEKFLKTPEDKVVCEVVGSPPLKSTYNRTNGSGLEIQVLDISTAESDLEPVQRKKSPYPPPSLGTTVSRLSDDDFCEDIAEERTSELPTSNPCSDDKDIAVNGEVKVDKREIYQWDDDNASEIDNYTDALATLESEVETDIEFRAKSDDVGFLNTEKHETDSDANDEQLQSQSQFSDSQSLANSTASDDGNSSIRKGVSSFSCSDTASTSAEIMPLTEIGEVDAPCIPSNQDSIIEKVRVDPLSEHEVSSGDCIEQAEIHADSAPMVLCVYSGSIFIENQSVGLESDDLSFNSGESSSGPMKSEQQTDDNSAISSDSTKTEEQRMDYDAQASSGPVKTEEPPLDDNSENSCCPMTTEEQQGNVDDSSQKREEITPILLCKEDPMDEAEVFDPTVDSSAGMDSANILEMVLEKEGSETSLDDVVQDEFTEDVSAGNSVDTQVMSPDSVISHAEEHPSVHPLAEFKIFGTCNLVEGQLAEKAADDFSDKYDLAGIDIADSRERNLDGTWEGELLLRGENGVEEGGIKPSLDLLASDSGSVFPESLDHPSKMDDHAQSDERDIETIQLEAVVERASDSSLAENRAQSDEGEHEIVQSEAAAERAPDSSVASEAKVSLHHNSNITVSPFTESSEQDFESESTYESSLIEKAEDASLFSRCIPSVTSLGEKVELQTCELDLRPLNTPGESPELEHIDSPSHVDHNTDSNTGFDSCALSLPTHPVDQEKDIQTKESDVISLQVGEVTCPEFSSQLENIDSPSLMDHKPDINADIDSGALILPTHSLDQEEELQAGEPEVGSLQMGEVTRESSRSEQVELNETDHESSAAPLSVKASVSELPQSSSHNFDLSEQAKFPLNSPFSGFNVLPEVAQLNLEEMPPLPPLPPMQWRIGKLHHSSLASDRNGDQQDNNLFPPIFPSKPNELMQPSNRFLYLPGMNIENSSHEDLAGNMVNSTPLLPQMPTVNHGDHRDDFLTLGQPQSSDLSSALPVTYNERPPHTFPAEEGKLIQPICKTFTPAITLTPTSMCSSETPHGEVTQSPQQLSTEVRVEKEEDDRSSAVSDMILVGPPKKFVSQPTIEKEQPEHVAPTSEEVTVSSSSTSVLASLDDEKPNGNRPMKLPRPRSPLIDAVAAHDKSKLRKVTERVRPEIQKVEERDSLLEQIRTKSFNLKPAVATRPTVQGPRTNLRVAAILEKANAIRQAFAGSDDDDDDDSWSDS